MIPAHPFEDNEGDIVRIDKKLNLLVKRVEYLESKLQENNHTLNNDLEG